MSDEPVMLTESSVGVIQDAIDLLYGTAPRTAQGNFIKDGGGYGLMRGYLMQGVSRGQQALCQMVTRREEFRNFKIDLAGIAYTTGTVGSKFKLRFKEGTTILAETDVIDTTNLTIGTLLEAIQNLTQIAPSPTTNLAPRLPYMTGMLGHPCQHSRMIVNDELYPPLPATYKSGDLIDSNIGSWIFSIPRSDIPEACTIKLLFSSGSDAVQLSGPAFMSIHEILDTPTELMLTVTDVMDVASPTPLRGGSKVIVANFPDVGLGIIAANVREYLFEQETEA